MNDPSLGNLSVRGATKKMLLNLQQFAYDQIAGMKVYFNDRLETIKETYAEESDMLYETLAEACKTSNIVKQESVAVEKEEIQKEDNSAQIIEDLRTQLDLETSRANIMTEKFEDIDEKYTKLISDHEELVTKHEKLIEK